MTSCRPSASPSRRENKGHVTDGGSARQATIKELPVSKGLAGVSMRLNPGGIRELHWHTIAAEWAFVIKGRVRTTVIGPDGTSEVNDFDPGDVWYFPRGHGHMLQGLGPGESHFVLIFDDGAFSEFGTFSTTDWLGHTPPEVLSKSLELPVSAFATFPKKELYIVQGRIPPAEIPGTPPRWTKAVKSTHRYPLLAQKPHSQFAGGEERRVSAREFPISTTITGVVLDLKPGGLRELHWHPNADEWQYYIRGHSPHDCFRLGWPRANQGIQARRCRLCTTGLWSLRREHRRRTAPRFDRFQHGDYQEISLSTWLAANPDAVLADNFQVPDSVVAKFPQHRVFIASKDGPGT